tara:strand:+ start:373 stop:684 length:312 start_codon:yes stop_codon:yes gene_type:complete
MDFIRKPEITDAIKSLRPTSTFSLVDDKYSTLVWNDTENAKPTESEVNAKLTELTTQWEAKEYQNKRAAEYPSIEAQLDDIYHNGVDGWKATIKAVKDKYPKP